ncbi:hypothetical protein Pssp01_33360 [Pseudomonas sp. NBRC 100443]|nr:hypothetical protein Pssp01_33360 [Pseudomonas sp. NBRC 100443]
MAIRPQVTLQWGVMEIEPLPGWGQFIANLRQAFSIKRGSQGSGREQCQLILDALFATDPTAQVFDIDSAHSRLASAVANGKPSAARRANQGLGR